jgi:hypothetical protein
MQPGSWFQTNLVSRLWTLKRKYGRAKKKEAGGKNKYLNLLFVCGGNSAGRTGPWPGGEHNKRHYGGLLRQPPKWLFGLAWPFRLRFERRELRKRPTSACSHLIFTACCGRSFRGRYYPTPFASSHVRPNPKSHFVMPRTLGNMGLGNRPCGPGFESIFWGRKETKREMGNCKIQMGNIEILIGSGLQSVGAPDGATIKDGASPYNKWVHQTARGWHVARLRERRASSPPAAGLPPSACGPCSQVTRTLYGR